MPSEARGRASPQTSRRRNQRTDETQIGRCGSPMPLPREVVQRRPSLAFARHAHDRAVLFDPLVAFADRGARRRRRLATGSGGSASAGTATRSAARHTARPFARSSAPAGAAIVREQHVVQLTGVDEALQLRQARRGIGAHEAAHVDRVAPALERNRAGGAGADRSNKICSFALVGLQIGDEGFAHVGAGTYANARTGAEAGPGATASSRAREHACRWSTRRPRCIGSPTLAGPGTHAVAEQARWATGARFRPRRGGTARHAPARCARAAGRSPTGAEDRAPRTNPPPKTPPGNPPPAGLPAPPGPPPPDSALLGPASGLPPLRALPTVASEYAVGPASIANRAAIAAAMATLLRAEADPSRDVPRASNSVQAESTAIATTKGARKGTKPPARSSSTAANAPVPARAAASATLQAIESGERAHSAISPPAASTATAGPSA